MWLMPASVMNVLSRHNSLRDTSPVRGGEWDGRGREEDGEGGRERERDKERSGEQG